MNGSRQERKPQVVFLQPIATDWFNKSVPERAIGTYDFYRNNQRWIAERTDDDVIVDRFGVEFFDMWMQRCDFSSVLNNSVASVRGIEHFTIPQARTRAHRAPLEYFSNFWREKKIEFQIEIGCDTHAAQDIVPRIESRWNKLVLSNVTVETVGFRADVSIQYSRMHLHAFGKFNSLTFGQYAMQYASKQYEESLRTQCSLLLLMPVNFHFEFYDDCVVGGQRFTARVVSFESVRGKRRETEPQIDAYLKRNKVAKIYLITTVEKEITQFIALVEMQFNDGSLSRSDVLLFRSPSDILYRVSPCSTSCDHDNATNAAPRVTFTSSWASNAKFRWPFNRLRLNHLCIALYPLGIMLYDLLEIVEWLSESDDIVSTRAQRLHVLQRTREACERRLDERTNQSYPSNKTDLAKTNKSERNDSCVSKKNDEKNKNERKIKNR